MELNELLKKTAKKRATIKKKHPSAPIEIAMDERPYKNDLPKDNARSGSSPAGTSAIVAGLLVRLALDVCDLAKEKTQERFSSLRRKIGR